MCLPKNPNEDMQARYEAALKNLVDSVAEIAQKVTADKIGWYGELAAKTALLESMASGLLDEFNCDQTRFEDDINSVFGGGW